MTSLIDSIQRMTPFQPWELSEISIRGDPLTTGLDGNCCQKRIGHEVSLGISLVAQVGEDIPVSLAACDAPTVGLVPHHSHKIGCFNPRTGLLEHFGMGHDTQESAHDEV